MSDFVSNATTSEDATLQNNGFWPGLKLSDFRASMRVDNVATVDRAAHALESAMLTVNARLWKFQQGQQQEGITEAAQIPARNAERDGDVVVLYKRAVWSMAKADLVERYRDYDATGDARDRADDMDPMVDDLRQSAAFAINDIQRQPRMTVELI